MVWTFRLGGSEAAAARPSFSPSLRYSVDASSVRRRGGPEPRRAPVRSARSRDGSGLADSKGHALLLTVTAVSITPTRTEERRTSGSVCFDVVSKSPEASKTSSGMLDEMLLPKQRLFLIAWGLAEDPEQEGEILSELRSTLGVWWGCCVI